MLVRSAIAIILVLAAVSAEAATLDRVRDQGVFRIGYRTDAVPFAYKNPAGQPTGYAVDLCRAVADEVKRRLGLPQLRIEYVPATADNGFEMVRQGQADILCGPTTETLSRRAVVDFSLMFFVDGASIIYHKGGPMSFAALAGHKIGVHGGTTTEAALRRLLVDLKVDAQVVAVPDHNQGFDRVASGEFAAYFADRSILAYMLSSDPRIGDLLLSAQYLTTEPYALAVPRGDSDFRLLVDATLARLYRSHDIERLFHRSFGTAAITPTLKTLFTINGLPD